MCGQVICRDRNQSLRHAPSSELSAERTKNSDCDKHCRVVSNQIKNQQFVDLLFTTIAIQAPHAEKAVNSYCIKHGCVVCRQVGEIRAVVRVALWTMFKVGTEFRTDFSQQRSDMRDSTAMSIRIIV